MRTSPEILRLDPRDIELRRTLAHGFAATGCCTIRLLIAAQPSSKLKSHCTTPKRSQVNSSQSGQGDLDPEAGSRRRAEQLYQQLDMLQHLRQQARRELLAAQGRESAVVWR